mgnify:CR=1 FL=1
MNGSRRTLLYGYSRYPPMYRYIRYEYYSNDLWERVVQYGQFQPINKQETEYERRKRRGNTFAMEIPENFIHDHGGRRRLLQLIRQKIED